MEVLSVKAIIFDFDGTVANTLPVNYHSFQTVFKKYDDKDFTDEEIKEMFGPVEPVIIQDHLEHSDKESAIETFYQTYEDKHSDLVDANSEMDDLLRSLKDKGLKLGIMTGKSRRSLDISLEKLGMSDLFDVIMTGDDVSEPKPHPEGVLKAIDQLGVSKEDVMFLGDSDSDIEAGQRAGVRTVGVHWLPEVQTKEFSHEPHQTFENISDFVDFLEGAQTR